MSARPKFTDVTLRQLPNYLRLHVFGLSDIRRLGCSFGNWYVRTHFHTKHGGNSLFLVETAAIVTFVAFLTKKREIKLKEEGVIPSGH
ncbi:hypothetical protein QOT17_006044 [Balamuthia mandrillaris]